MIHGIGIVGGSGSTSVASANVGSETFEATAGQTAFTVTAFTVNEIEVFVNGSLQTWGYSVSGNTVTFTTAFNGGEEIVIQGIK